MKLYMKTNSPFLKPYITGFEDADYSFWDDWVEEHMGVIEDYYGFPERLNWGSNRFLLDPKSTYIEISKSDELLMVNGVMEVVYTLKATKNIGKNTTNRCFKDDIPSWDRYDWSSDGKTVELSFEVGDVVYSLEESYIYGRGFLQPLINVIEAMKVLKGLDKVRGKEIRLNQEQKKQLEKIKTIYTKDPEQAISLADALGLLGNLKSEMTSDAYGIIKENGVNITKIEGL